MKVGGCGIRKWISFQCADGNLPHIFWREGEKCFNSEQKISCRQKNFLVVACGIGRVAALAPIAFVRPFQKQSNGENWFYAVRAKRSKKSFCPVFLCFFPGEFARNIHGENRVIFFHQMAHERGAIETAGVQDSDFSQGVTVMIVFA